MADEFDYTKMWSGSFSQPPVGDDGQGIYLQNDPTSSWDTEIYDDSTRNLYNTTEPDRYARGSRKLGNPGYRGMITSGRSQRSAIDDADWDERPPHFAPNRSNSYSHLYVDPAARGPPIFQEDFMGRGSINMSRYVELFIILIIYFVLIRIMLANVEKRMIGDIGTFIQGAMTMKPTLLPNSG